ncbi:MAG: xanthine dehydrogenase accessory protein XdhC [Burkholderiaceae bacterium]
MSLPAFLQRLSVEPAILVAVRAVRGSAPREVGAWMAVFPDDQFGTVGGGQLEWSALAQARSHLATASGSADAVRQWCRSVALGPGLGQCCGGHMELHFEQVEARDVPRLRQQLSVNLRPLALFGGGHVGQAIVQALLPLPFDLTWIDSRDQIFPVALVDAVRCEHSEPVHRAVDALAPGSLVMVMSFSHAEDLDIVMRCLERQRRQGDLPFVGLIGSRTKWAVFRRRLAERGFSSDEIDHITCPIGLPGIGGKQPAVIAASVAAQLLMVP